MDECRQVQGGKCRQLLLLRAEIFTTSLTQSELDHHKVDEPRSRSLGFIIALFFFHDSRYYTSRRASCAIPCSGYKLTTQDASPIANDGFYC